MRGEILSKSVVSRPSGDPYLTISRVSIILSEFAKMVPSPRPYRSGLVVRPPAWDPKGARGARFDSLGVCSNLNDPGAAQKLFARQN